MAEDSECLRLHGDGKCRLQDATPADGKRDRTADPTIVDLQLHMSLSHDSLNVRILLPQSLRRVVWLRRPAKPLRVVAVPTRLRA